MVWNQYSTKKLLHFAYMRNKKPYLLYSSLCEKMKDYKLKDIIEVEQNIFLIQNPKDENISYIVNGNIGVCTCYSGKSGALCKHQCFLIENQKIKLPNALPIDREERYLLGYLALGKECPKPEFFHELKQSMDEIIPMEIPQYFTDTDYTPLLMPPLLLKLKVPPCLKNKTLWKLKNANYYQNWIVLKAL